MGSPPGGRDDEPERTVSNEETRLEQDNDFTRSEKRFQIYDRRANGFCERFRTAGKKKDQSRGEQGACIILLVA